MEFLLRVLSSNGRPTERERDAKEAKEIFRANQDNIGRVVAEEHSELISPLLEMIYESCFPEEQVFMKNPSLERLNANKHVVTRILSGLSAQGIPAIDLLCRAVDKHGVDPVADCIITLLAFLSRLLANRDDPTFTTDDVLNTIDLEWQCSSRIGSPLLSVLSSKANSPARLNLSTRKLDSSATCGLSSTIRSPDGRIAYDNSQSMKFYTVLRNATFPKRVFSTLSTTMLNYSGSTSQETTDLAIRKPAIDTVRLRKASTSGDSPEQQSRHYISVENLPNKSKKQQSEEPDSLASRSSEKLLSDGTLSRDPRAPNGTFAIPSSSEEKVSQNLPSTCLSHESEHTCSNSVLYEVESPDNLKAPILESICNENSNGLTSAGLLEASELMNLSPTPSVVTDLESTKIDCQTSLEVPVEGISINADVPQQQQQRHYVPTETFSTEVQKQESDEQYSVATSSIQEMSSDETFRNQRAVSKTLAKPGSPNEKAVANLPTATVSYESDCNCSNPFNFDVEIPESLKVPILEHTRRQKVEGLVGSLGLWEQSQRMNLSSKPSVLADAASMKIDYQTKLTVPDISCTSNDELTVWAKHQSEVTSDHNDSTVSNLSEEPYSDSDDDKNGIIFDSSSPADLFADDLYRCPTSLQRKESNNFQIERDHTPLVARESEDLSFEDVPQGSALMCGSQHVRENTNGTLNVALEKPELTNESKLITNAHPCFRYTVGNPLRNVSVAAYPDGRDNSSDSEDSVISDYSSDSSAKFSSWSLCTSASVHSTVPEDLGAHLNHQKTGSSPLTMDPLITASTHVTDIEKLLSHPDDSHIPSSSSFFPSYKLLTSGEPADVSSNLNLRETSGSDVYEYSRNILTDIKRLPANTPERCGLGTSLPFHISVSGTHLEATNSIVMDISRNIQLEATRTSRNSPSSEGVESSEHSCLNVSPSSTPCSKSTVSSHSSSPTSEMSGRSMSRGLDAYDATLIMVKQIMDERHSQHAIVGVDRIDSDESKGWNNGRMMERSPHLESVISSNHDALSADSMVFQNTAGNHVQSFQISPSIQSLEVVCNSVDGEAEILTFNDKEESAENVAQASQVANKQRTCEVRTEGLSMLALSNPLEVGQKEGPELEVSPNSKEDGQGGYYPCQQQACAEIENVDVRPKVSLTKRTEESNCSTSSLSGNRDSYRIELVPLFQLTRSHEVEDYTTLFQPSQVPVNSDVEFRQHLPTEESIPRFQPREIHIQRCTEGINLSNNDASNMLNLNTLTLEANSKAATVTDSDNSTETHILTTIPAEIYGLETLSSDVNRMKEFQSDGNENQRSSDDRSSQRMRVGSQSSESFSRRVDENEGNASLIADGLLYDSTPEILRTTGIESSKEHHRPVKEEELCDKTIVSHFSCAVPSETDGCSKRNRDSNCAVMRDTGRCDLVCYTDSEDTSYVTTLKSHSNSLFRSSIQSSKVPLLETGISRSSSRPRKRRSLLVKLPGWSISSCLCFKQPSTRP